MNENVREYEELMSLYLEGKCTPEQAARLEEWVSVHPDNAKEYHRFRNVWEAEHPAFRFDSIDVDKAKERVLESVGEGHGKSGIFIEWWKNVAAVLLLPLLFLGTVLSYEMYFKKSQDVEWQKFSAPYGVYADIVLPDHSKVCLNSGSTLSYPSRFVGGKRSVKLEGEAYFEVRSDNDHPFSVNVGDMEVTATGTEFNIEAYSGTSQRVTLVTGKLGVSVPGKVMRYLRGTSCSVTETARSLAFAPTLSSGHRGGLAPWRSEVTLCLMCSEDYQRFSTRILLSWIRKYRIIR